MLDKRALENEELFENLESEIQRKVSNFNFESIISEHSEIVE